ncbi:MAG: isoprenyl transferase [Phycisphaerales bacterium JB043]
MTQTSDAPDASPRVPRHVAIIMDGNGRWANQRGLERWEGHRAGVEAVRRTLESARDLGIHYLTLYSFSSENWKRPRDEIDALMELLSHSLRSETSRLIEHNIRLLHIGDIEGLPEAAQRDLTRAIEDTAHCDGHTLILALNYGSRDEITRATRSLASRVREGELEPADITPELIGDTLDTSGVPEPDLLIRTAGEMRLSNFLLWQLCYAEIHVTRTLWPDFDGDSLRAALDDFAQRDRRFGGLTPSPAGQPNAPR